MGWFESTAHDIRFALRRLRGSPTFTAASILTLALGIGAATALFSVVNAALLRPLPYPRPDSLVALRTRLVDGRVTTGLVSNAELTALSRLPLVERAAGYFSQPFESSLITEDGAPVTVMMSGVSEGFFDVLGLPMGHGRAFLREEHVRSGPGDPLSVVLSDAAWSRLFSRDPAIVGRTIRLAEVRVLTTVVGVASPLVDLPHGVDIWFNGRVAPQDNAHVLNGVARLKDGAGITQLAAAGNSAMQALGTTDPSAAGREWVLRPLVASIVGDLRPVLLIVLGATVLLLGLACVNVTNLLLARGVGRNSECALRSALGGSRGRIVRQLLTESLVLAAGGGLLGFAIAAAAVRALLVFSEARLPRLDTVGVDARVALFGLAAAGLSGLITGLWPAWRLAGADVRSVLADSTRSTSPGRGTSRAMSSLIVAEVALAVVLVAGAGWLVQSFARLRSVDPGFVTSGRLVVDVRSTRLFADAAAGLAWGESLLQHLRAASGRRPAGSGSTYPLRGDQDGTLNIEFSDEPRDPTHRKGSQLRFASAGYFEAMGVRLLAGRTFTDDDRRTTQRVAVVNHAFARRYLDGRDPLTGVFAYSYPEVDRKAMTRIVGVVADMRTKSLAQLDEPTFYVPQAQMPYPITRHAVVIATDGSPEAAMASLRDELLRFDPQLAIKYTTADAILSAATMREQLGMTLMLAFGTVALVLAAVGIYGVIAYRGEQRRGELATRLALGARPDQVFRLMLRESAAMSVAGVGLGLVLAFAGARLMSGYVYDMRATDPFILISSALVVGLAAALASVPPAVRASRTAPARALRPDQE